MNPDDLNDDVMGLLEIKVDGDILRISTGIEIGRVYIGFKSGEGGDFNAKDFAEHILKFYKERF